MTAPAAPEVDRPRQLWLDVERPMFTRPRRPRLVEERAEYPPTIQQLELKMAPAPRKQKKATSVARPAPEPAPAMIVPEPLLRQEAATPAIVETDRPVMEPKPVQPFGSWLFDQAKRPGLIGELAKAAKLDRLFPKNGSVDDVRDRFAVVGADGDALMALEDAEREYDRL